MLNDDTPSFLSLAGFGRLHNVAGATVTGWKRRGYLVLVDGKVDVRASNARLGARPSTLRGGTAKVRPGKPVELGPAAEFETRQAGRVRKRRDNARSHKHA